MKKVLCLYLDFILFMLVLIISSSVSGALKDVVWAETYGGLSDDVALAVIQTRDGGFAFVGSTGSYGAGRSDAWVVKTDATGEIEWNLTYGGRNWDRFVGIVQTSDGGFVLAGDTDSTRSHDAFLMKIDVTKELIWSKIYGGTASDGINTVIQTNDGGFVLAGYTYSYGEGRGDAWVVKTDATGEIEWHQAYGGREFDIANSIIQTSDGGFLLAGSTDSYGAGRSDAWVVKTDVTGKLVWNQIYGGLDGEQADAVIQTSDGGFVLAGFTYSYGEGYSDGWLVKTDATGELVWNQTYGGTEFEYIHAIIQISDGGFVFAGSTSSYGKDDHAMWLVKTDSDGKMAWMKTYDGTERAAADAVIQTSDSGFVLAGYTFSYTGGYNKDALLIRMNDSAPNSASTYTTTGLPISGYLSLGALGVAIGLIVLKTRSKSK
ncbi:MAG: hypothetical protein ACFFCZ_08810 [Promethearchaeota archaeon]